MEQHHQSPHLIILPTPGMGHIIPLAEFAKKLIALHNFTVTFTIPTGNTPSKTMTSYLQSLPPSISSIILPPVSVSDLPDDVKIETRMSLTVIRSLPSLRDAISSIVSAKPVVAFVVDLFGTDALQLASEFKIKPFVFFTSTAMALSFFKHLPELDESFSYDFKDHPEPIKLPGCVPLNGSEILDPAQDKKNDAYKWLLHHAKRYKLAQGIILNSFMGLEPGAIKALKEDSDRETFPPVYPVGPLIQTGSNGGEEREDKKDCPVLKWLDEQSNGSVLFVSFGSGGTLSSAQINELAFGLAKSGQRFLWVLRSPSDKTAHGTYFSVHSSNDPLAFLPEGFLERTKNVGLVVPSWAPQIRVLNHGSTGGFLTHCGWNSILESVVHGVPMISWPLYAEQKMNRVMLVEDLGVALNVKSNENGIVERDEICGVVKELMEGEEGKKMRNKMKELKESAIMAYGDNGSSLKALGELAQHLKIQQNGWIENKEENGNKESEREA